MLSQKTRNNASIAYFFLGWLFLLAKKNPDFSDPFIRQHAKIATKGHVFFFVAYFFYSQFLSGFFSHSIPVIQITVDYGIRMAFFFTLVLFIVRGAYRGQKSEDGKGENEKTTDGSFFTQGRTFGFSEASEGQRILLLLSHIPFLGMIIAKKNPNIVTVSGARISSVFWFVYLLSLTSGGFGSLSMILLFLGILSLVFLATRFFLNNEYTVPAFFEKLPGIKSVYATVRSVPSYLADIGRLAFGKKDGVIFANHLKKTREKDENLHSTLSGYFTDATLPFPSFWIFVPFFNFVFLPKLLMSRTTRFVLAIGQGLVITLLAICIGLFFGFTSPLELFLLFPIFYGIASIESDTFARIPFVYEIYAVINTLTFGLLKNTKRLRSVQEQDTEVHFKIE